MSVQTGIHNGIVNAVYWHAAKDEAEKLLHKYKTQKSVYEPVDVDIRRAPQEEDLTDITTNHGWNSNVRDMFNKRIREQTVQFIHDIKDSDAGEGHSDTSTLRLEIPYTLLTSKAIKRRKISWNQIFSLMDYLESADVKLLAVMGDWIDGDHTPPNLKTFDKYLEQFIEVWDNRVVGYEFGNEPNHKFFWKGTDVDYARFAKNGYNTLKDYNSKAQVGINFCRLTELDGNPWGLIFADRLLREGTDEVLEKNAVNMCDFTGIHGYPGMWEPGNAFTWNQYLSEYDAFADENNIEAKPWATEQGITGSRWGIFTGNTPENQAQYFIDTAQVMQENNVRFSLWYRALDLNHYSDSTPQWWLPPEHYFGLLDKKGRPKVDNIVDIVAEAVKPKPMVKIAKPLQWNPAEYQITV
jgi:hypothetical protein